MSAEIISLEAWRREHSAHHEPEQNALKIPFFVPTWPCGWLQPMLVEIDVRQIAEFGALAACAAGQTGFGGLLYRDRALRPDRDQGKSATVHQLFQAPTARVKAARESY
jgi:hypothetical protein